MSERHRRQRPVLVGELPRLQAKTGVPELLREFGPRTMSRAELEGARRAFVCRALDRRFAREEEDRRNARYASDDELLTPLIELLAELPPHLHHSESELQRLMDACAGDILSAAGTSLHHDATGKCRLMERPREAVAALKTLRKAALKIGPLAEQTLDQSGELLKLDTYVGGAPSLRPHEYLLIDKIDAAIEALQLSVSKGRREPGGNQPRGARIADQVAHAYAEITGELPPTTNPYHGAPSREPPYHRLVRRIFERYCQRNWKECAKVAAERLHEIGKLRHLRTARPGRRPRAADVKRGVE